MAEESVEIDEWEVLPYEPIDRMEMNLWAVEGDLPTMALRRRMTIAKCSDGRLVIHNAIKLHEDDMAEIEAWGEPAFLLVPSGWHRLDAPAYKQRYPNIKVLCPAGATDKVLEKVDVDGGYEDFPDDPRVSLETLDGTGAGEGVMTVFHGPAKDHSTLVFNDAIFNQPHLTGLEGLIMRLLGSTGGPKVTRICRWFVLKDKKAFKHHLTRLVHTPGLARLIMSHGHIIDERADEVLAAIAAKL